MADTTATATAATTNPLRLGYWHWEGSSWKAPRPPIPAGWAEHPEVTRYRKTRCRNPFVEGVDADQTEFDAGRVYVTGRDVETAKYDYKHDPEANFQDSGLAAAGIGWPVRIRGTWRFRQVVSAEHAAEHARRWRPLSW